MQGETGMNSRSEHARLYHYCQNVQIKRKNFIPIDACFLQPYLILESGTQVEQLASNVLCKIMNNPFFRK